MPEQRKSIFVSCGQFTDEERALGEAACKLVDELTPFAGYFAQNEVSLEMLSRNVLSRLYESVGLVAIMHHRGVVETPGRKLIRASVWIEQEVAIAALMQQVLHRALHVALFIQHGVEIEGIRQQLHLNPIIFENGKEVIARLREILPDWREPLYISKGELEARVRSVELGIKVLRGWALTLTIEARNFSDVPVQIKSIGLRSQDVKLCEPIRRPEGANWAVLPNGGGPIQFGTNEDIGQRLIGIYGKRQTAVPVYALRDPANYFSAVISVELRCEILGIETRIADNCSVEVNLTTREITGQ